MKVGSGSGKSTQIAGLQNRVTTKSPAIKKAQKVSRQGGKRKPRGGSSKRTTIY